MIIPALVAIVFIGLIAALAGGKKDDAKALPPGPLPDVGPVVYEHPDGTIDTIDPATGGVVRIMPNGDVVKLPVPGTGILPPGTLPVQATPPATPPAVLQKYKPEPAPTGVIPPVGVASGAVSIAKDGSVDDSFDELVASAIMSGNVQQLTNLAEQARQRGLNAVYNSIQEEIARIIGAVPILTSGPAVQPKAGDISKPTGRAIISWKAGSRGPDVIEWQRLIGALQDGVFGENTDKATRAWQKARGLVSDGVVGPTTWAAAYAGAPALAVTPRPAVVVTTPSARPTLSMAMGSRGPAVEEWQKLIGHGIDGVFGQRTHDATKAWQSRNGLKADGVVGAATWAKAYAIAPALSVVPIRTTNPPVSAPTPVQSGIIPASFTPAPAPMPVAAVPAETDKRAAARELTAYLQSIGGLAGRPVANSSRVAGYLARLGVPDPSGKYGRQGAGAVMLEGLVPVVPYYWPKAPATNQAKVDFTNLVKSYQAADPQRSAQWQALLSDIQRS